MIEFISNNLKQNRIKAQLNIFKNDMHIILATSKVLIEMIDE